MENALIKFLKDNDIDTLEKLRNFMRFQMESSIANHNVTPEVNDVQMAKIDEYFNKVFDTDSSKADHDNFMAYQVVQHNNWVHKQFEKNEAEQKSMQED